MRERLKHCPSKKCRCYKCLDNDCPGCEILDEDGNCYPIDYHCDNFISGDTHEN